MKKNHVAPVARLVPPHADKNWSFQAVNVSEDDVYRIKRAFSHPAVCDTSPFLQGNSRGWVMVEFWTKDKAAIDRAAQHFFGLFKLAVVEGDFTREDLGLA